MQNSMFDNTTRLLATTLDFTLRRHKVIAANMANVETPNFKARDLPFNAYLKAGLHRVHKNPGSSVTFQQPRLVFDTTGELRFDGNNVNAENEMIKLMKNTGRHSLAAELIKYKFTTLREAIRPSR
jgi:flagellar basal-body rod protein FlgB